MVGNRRGQTTMKNRYLILSTVLLTLCTATPLLAASNKALVLDGTNAYMEVPDSPQLRLSAGEFSIVLRLKLDAYESTELQSALLAKRGSGFDDGWIFFVRGDNNLSATHKISFQPLSGQVPQGETIPTLHDWHHVALVRTTNACLMYLDGIQMTVTNAIGAPPWPWSSASCSSVLRIGRDSDAGNPSRYALAGKMDNIQIWSKALSATDVQTNIISGPTGQETNLIAYWNFDDGTANDLTTNHHDGVLYEGAVIREIPPNASATNRVLTLDGNSDCVDVGASSMLRPDRFTMMAWFRCSSSNDSERTILGTWDYGSAGSGRNIQLRYGNKLGVWDGAVGLTGQVSCVAQQWYHVALTYDGTNLCLYQDGELAGSSTYTPQSGGRLTIGAFQYVNGSSGFDGQIDEVSVWQRALSQCEIRSLYNKRLSGEEVGLVGYWNFDDGTATDITWNGSEGNFLYDATTIPDTDVACDIYLAIEVAFLSGGPLTAYQLQMSTNMLSTNWVNVGSAIRGSGNQRSLFDGPRGNSPRFYRVISTY